MKSPTYSERHLLVDVFIHVDMTDALRVAQDRDGFALLLDGPHKVTGPSGDHEVNVLVQVEEVLDVFTATHLVVTQNSISIKYVHGFLLLVLVWFYEPLSYGIFLRKYKNTFAFSIICQNWDGTRGWKL